MVAMSQCIRLFLSTVRYRDCLLLAVALFLTACSGRQPVASTPATVPPLTPSPVVGEGGPTPVADQERQVVVWLPAFSGVAAGDAAGDVLTTAIFQFQQAHPGVRVEVQVKAESGTAGLWPFLRTTQAVAPSALPDLVLLDTQHLWQGVDLGMIDTLSEQELGAVEDFYPAALQGVRYDSRLLGIPYALDVVHVVYHPEEAEAALPAWDNLLANAPVYLFPGAGIEGQSNLHMLAQYLGAGGILSDAGGRPDLEAAQAYYDFLATARLQGVIPPRTAELAGFTEVYAEFQEAPDGLAAVLSSNMLAGAEATRLHYAALPTRTGEPATVGDVWAFAVLTRDAEHRALTLALVAALLEPDTQGAWSRFADRLPSRRSALAEWEQATSYRAFLEQQIESAAAVPNGRAFADFARRLQMGQTAVLRGDMTPDEAVRGLGGAP